MRREHKAFYRRVFGSKELAGARSAPGLPAPVCLMAADFGREGPDMVRRYPYLASTAAEREAIFADFRIAAGECVQ